MVSTAVLFSDHDRNGSPTQAVRHNFLQFTSARERIASATKSDADCSLISNGASMNFGSDNGAGVAPQILDAVVASSRVYAPAYGADEYTERAQALLSEAFETKVAAFLVATGTAANALALSALVNPWDAVFCHGEAHIHDDECGAPELFSAGAKLVGIRGRAARSLLKACWRRWKGSRAGSLKGCSRARCRCLRLPKRGRSMA